MSVGRARFRPAPPVPMRDVSYQQVGAAGTLGCWRCCRHWRSCALCGSAGQCHLSRVQGPALLRWVVVWVLLVLQAVPQGRRISVGCSCGRQWARSRPAIIVLGAEIGGGGESAGGRSVSRSQPETRATSWRALVSLRQGAGLIGTLPLQPWEGGAHPVCLHGLRLPVALCHLAVHGVCLPLRNSGRAAAGAAAGHGLPLSRLQWPAGADVPTR